MPRSVRLHVPFSVGQLINADSGAADLAFLLLVLRTYRTVLWGSVNFFSLLLELSSEEVGDAQI